MPSSVSYETFRQKLIERLNDLLSYNYEKLLSILYRIDVSEQKAKQQLAAHPEKNPAEIFADLIIERELQKIKTRAHYKGDKSDW